MTSVGEELHAFVERMYPIARSITGPGLRETLSLIGERIPLDDVRFQAPCKFGRRMNRRGPGHAEMLTLRGGSSGL